MPIVFDQASDLLDRLSALDGGIILVDGIMKAGKSHFADQASAILSRQVMHTDDARKGQIGPILRADILKRLAIETPPNAIIEGVCALDVFATIQTHRPDLVLAAHIYVRAWYPLVGGKPWRDPGNVGEELDIEDFEYWTRVGPVEKADFVLVRETKAND